MSNIGEVEKWVDMVKGSFIGDEDIVVKWDRPNISSKIKSNIIGEAFRVGFTPDDYWSNEYARIPFVYVSDELEEVRIKVDGLSENVEGLKSEVLSCKECINRLSEELSERPIIKETRLFEIGEGIEVMQPIPIVIEETEEEVIASFPEVEVYASGLVEANAINNLKSQIKELFFDLVESKEDELGKLPKAWRRTLEKVVRKIGKA